MAGKVDWLAHNLSIEGTQADIPTAGRVARNDVVTCALGDRVGEVRKRIERSPYRFALVTAPNRVLLGRLRASSLHCDPNLTSEQVMESGPSTVRPDTSVDKLLKRLAERELHWAIVTDPEGRLVGVASRNDLERA